MLPIEMKGFALFKGSILMSYNVTLIRNIVAKIMNEMDIFVFILIKITIILLKTPAMKGFRQFQASHCWRHKPN